MNENLSASQLAQYITDAYGSAVVLPNGTFQYFIANSNFSALPPAINYAGRIFRITDLGNALFESNGTRWKPVNSISKIASLDTAFGMSGTTETIAFQKAIPAGALQNGDRLRLLVSLGKSGTSETMTYNLRMGTLGTISDTLVQGFTVLQTTSVSAGFISEFRRNSATQLQKLGNGSQTSSFNSTSTASVPPPVTISSLDASQIFITVTSTMSSTVETGTIYDVSLELLSSGA
jgi:hypothetical protein